MSNAGNPQDPNDPGSLSLTPSSSGAGTQQKADFSNVQSGSSSTEDPAPTADFSNVVSGASSTEEIIGEQTYTVQKDDTLSGIAKQFYGKASAYRVIFEANRDQLDDPDRIKPGQVLNIPPRQD